MRSLLLLVGLAVSCSSGSDSKDDSNAPSAPSPEERTSNSTAPGPDSATPAANETNAASGTGAGNGSAPEEAREPNPDAAAAGTNRATPVATTNTTNIPCNVGNASDNEHPLALSQLAATGNYEIDFANAADRALNVVSVYVTGPDDAVPVFPRFSFSGKPYWMVVVGEPFEERFTLPVTYGELPPLGRDLTVKYGSPTGMVPLTSLTAPACVKFTVITWEPDLTPSFRTSAFRHLHQPRA